MHSHAYAQSYTDTELGATITRDGLVYIGRPLTSAQLDALRDSCGFFPPPRREEKESKKSWRKVKTHE